MVLLAVVTHLIRVKTVAPVITIASLMASPARILVSWRLVDWQVVRWYLPGAIGGAIVGSWFFTFAAAPWLRVIVGLFLISTPFQYRLGSRARSFPMRLAWFIPLSFAVGLISGIIGASSLVSAPFYLNYGLTKERMIATRRGAFTFHSAHQDCDLWVARPARSGVDPRRLEFTHLARIVTGARDRAARTALPRRRRFLFDLIDGGGGRDG